MERLLNVCFSDDGISVLLRKCTNILMLISTCQNTPKMDAYTNGFLKLDAERNGSHFQYYFRQAVELI